MERRIFLARFVQVCSALITTLFALPIFAFIRGAFNSNRAESTYPIGSVQDVQAPVTRVPYTRLKRDGWQVRMVEEYVWVRKQKDGTILVFEPHCTHLGCAYDWDARTQLFLCPCHGGKFDADGKHVAGPPPRDLDQFDTKVEGNQIRIGKIVKA